jgi:hypothetical protein
MNESHTLSLSHEKYSAALLVCYRSVNWFASTFRDKIKAPSITDRKRERETHSNLSMKTMMMMMGIQFLVCIAFACETVCLFVQSTYAIKVKIDIDANLTVIHGQCYDYYMTNDEQYSLFAITTHNVCI